jgi:NodT family efflux transporter outer membrane factor (OMF) lipoprotein
MSLKTQKFFGLSVFLIGALALLPGCKVGPDYQRPPALGTNAMPAAFTGAETNHGEWKVAEPSAHLPRGQWWQVFTDAELDRLQGLANANNQELAAAVARVTEARAEVKIARADLFPQIATAPNYTRQRTSFNEPQNGHAAHSAPIYNTFTLPVAAGWEADLWGRIRREVESARAQLTASADDMESAKLAIQAEVASDYFTLRDLQLEYNVLERTVETYRHSLELTMNRRRGGIATDLDVSQAETQLKTTEAELPGVRLQEKQLTHALATLCGEPATQFEVSSVRTNLEQPPSIPLSLPSELLERRPDVAAAEQRMASANAQVGVAKGAFYPRVLFNGLAGFQSVSASSWFDWPSRFWSVGPTLELPLFIGGRNKAQLALAKATYEETVANYRQTVLGAFQEVEDQLAATRLLEEQLAATVASLAAAQRTLDIANNRYKAGLVTYLEVAVAQSSELSLERTVVQLQGQKLVAAVGLVRALGGGWDSREAREARN